MIRCLPFCLILLLAESAASPVIPADQRFHGDAVTAERGQLLIQELNCAACHRLPVAIPRPAPRLDAVGSRLTIPSIMAFIEAPQRLKPGTLMPHLPAAGADAEAIAHYLASRTQAQEAPAKGDATVGRELFHSIGCVACHAPEVPMALGSHYRRGALAAFLLDPSAIRPAGRMPGCKLSAAEAADLEAYLNPQPATSETARDDLITRGEAAYKRNGCVACHEQPAKPVSITSPEHGCLADAPPPSTPHFSLSDRQRQSIRLALKPDQPVRSIVNHTLETFNCYACHERLGKGGVPEARRPYFQAKDPNLEAVGDLGKFPPGLHVTGRKLTPEWLTRIVTGEGGEVRPYLKTRMPRFPKDGVHALLAAWPKADRLEKPISIDVSGGQRHHRGHYGRALLGSGNGGMACITCHGLQGVRAIGSGVIDLTQTTKRLKPAFFKELLLNPAAVQPGTIMPPLFNGRKKANQEIEQIWTYLKEADQQRLPDGLLRSDDYELFPAKEQRPIVFRTFIEGVGTQAIAVGHPEGVHAAFDAYASRWALLWRGRFLDAGTTWTDRFSAPDKALGTDLKSLPATAAFDGKLSFRGFRLDKAQRPIFLYHLGEWSIEDQLRPTGTGFTRVLRVRGPDGSLMYRPFSGEARELIIQSGITTVEEPITW
ncbi:MAG: mono/diheme cytochrome c family protein [Rhodothermales bacterium]|jgi:mono/diheme cytochrome c family protein